MRDKSTSHDADEPLLASVDRQRMLTRRLYVVIASAILTFMACAIFGLRFGSADQAFFTTLSIAIIFLLLRVLRSKGRFRFASLLLLTAFCAIVFRQVLRPLKRQSDQRTAMESVTRKGGKVDVYGGADRYPRNADGWVITPTGYLYPALLFYLENKYLNPREVYGLRIPSSLLNTATWNSLQCENINRLDVILDGSGNGLEFSDILIGKPRLFHSLVFIAKEMRAGDVDFLNGMRWAGTGREMPALRLDEDCRFEPRLLEGLDVGFELLVEQLPNDPSFLNRLLLVEKLKRISFDKMAPPEVFYKTISKRSHPIESLKIHNCNFDVDSWQHVCESNSNSFLRLTQIYFQSQRMTPTVLEQLGQNRSLKELIVGLHESQASAIPSLLRIKGLKRFEVHCDASCDDNITEMIRNTALESVWINMQLASDFPAEPEPWMERMKSFQIGKKQLIRFPTVR